MSMRRHCEEDGDPGLSELEDGTRVSAETSRRIACDSEPGQDRPTGRMARYSGPVEKPARCRPV